jgi:MazG family protein
VLTFAIHLLQEKDPGFNLEKIASHAYDKIKSRHPHVFGDQVANTKEEGLAHWDRIKETERQKKGATKMFSDIAGGLSPIRKAEKIQKRAAARGFDWPDAMGVLAKIREEIDEVEQELCGDPATMNEDEIGDLYFSVVNLSRFLKIDGEKSLARANAKFIKRYHRMEKLVAADDKNFEKMTLEEMDAYWERAKKELSDL